MSPEAVAAPNVDGAWTTCTFDAGIGAINAMATDGAGTWILGTRPILHWVGW